MAYEFSRADVAYLASPEGQQTLATAAELPFAATTMIGDLTALRRHAGEFAPAVAETVLLRRRAVQRWGAAAASWGCDGWLLTDTALQQASPPPVSGYRARRLADHVRAVGLRGVHDVTCSVGTDLVALASAGVSAVGSDIDPVRLGMAQYNLRHTAGIMQDPPPSVVTAHRQLLRADARTATTTGFVRYADPARRDATGRRIRSADTVPSVAELDSADPHRLPVLRLPPAIDYLALDRPGEIEMVSWQGTVREAVAWPPGLATARRRATVLHSVSDTAGSVLTADVITDSDSDDAVVAPPGRYLVDPDPAVVRAHLVRHYAARHGLHLLDDHLAYLSGDVAPTGVRGFEILDGARYAERTVREWCRRDGVGTLEIKQRGTSVIPEELRRRIRPSGDTTVKRTLIVARIGREPYAWWCRPTAPNGPPQGDTRPGAAQ